MVKTLISYIKDENSTFSSGYAHNVYYFGGVRAHIMRCAYQVRRAPQGMGIFVRVVFLTRKRASYSIFLFHFMIISSILSLLLSTSVTLRRDMSILFNRATILGLIYCVLQDMICLAFISKSIGLHGGLLHITNITQIFQIFVFLISILILQLTSFYPRKV